MRTVALEVAAGLELEIQLQEINDFEQLSQAKPLNLPRLYLNGQLIDSRNPPKRDYLVEQFRKSRVQAEVSHNPRSKS
jgi:hypothetical protein